MMVLSLWKGLTSPALTAEAIVQRIADQHGVTLEELRGPRRFARVRAARRESIAGLTAAGFSNLQVCETIERDSRSLLRIRGSK